MQSEEQVQELRSVGSREGKRHSTELKESRVSDAQLEACRPIWIMSDKDVSFSSSNILSMLFDRLISAQEDLPTTRLVCHCH